MGIYLTGGGEQEYFTDLDKYFISQLAAPAKLLLIPQASNVSDYQDILARIEEVFASKFVTQIDLLDSPNALSQEQVLSYQGMIFEGGNTFQLISSIRDSQFFNHIKAFQKTGKPIYADSAGAIMLGCDVQTAFLGDDADEDHRKLQDYRGLDIISPWSVHAHYEPDDYETLEELLYDKGNPIIALSESAGIYIDENTIINMGSAPVDLITFSGKETLVVGEKFSVV